jgi:arylsulfatase A
MVNIMKSKKLCVRGLFQWTAAGLVAATGNAEKGHAAEDARRQNIILILADDLGYMDLGCYGSSVYRTPNIDKLAEQGLRFTDAYAAAHICSPTRASIMTGKYPARLRLTDWIPGHKSENKKLLIPDWTKELKHSEVTVGEYLKYEGYTTAWLGKWHLHGEGRCRGQGFDVGQQDWDLNSKKDNADPKGVFTLNQEAMKFMEEAGDKPFFVGVSHYAVHTPVRFNQDLKKAYDAQGIPENFNAGYCAMVEDFDRSVGELLDWVDEQGLADNSIVVFYSDNGGLSKYTDNSPLRAGKATLYEGGTRVPLIVRWPGKVAPGSVTTEMVSSIDLLPTFLEMAGGQPPKDIDGLSLVPLLTAGRPVKRETLCWHYPHYHIGMPGSSIRKGDYKLIEFFEDGKIELYDLANDLSETINLVDRMPEKATELLADLNKWRRDTGAQKMALNPDWSGE